MGVLFRQVLLSLIVSVRQVCIAILWGPLLYMFLAQDYVLCLLPAGRFFVCVVFLRIVWCACGFVFFFVCRC